MQFGLIQGKPEGIPQQLVNSMLRDRAAVFCQRLGWPLAIDEAGRERDRYDSMRPIYCIVETGDGDHASSARLMPTTGATMLREVFADLVDGALEPSPLIWEVTRFCVSPRIELDLVAWVGRVLALGLWEFASATGIERYVGVCDRSMIDVYRQLGWEPTILRTRAGDGEDICLGLWQVRDDVGDRLRALVGRALSVDLLSAPLAALPPWRSAVTARMGR